LPHYFDARETAASELRHCRRRQNFDENVSAKGI